MECPGSLVKSCPTLLQFVGGPDLRQNLTLAEVLTKDVGYTSCERNPCLLNDVLGENAHTAHPIVVLSCPTKVIRVRVRVITLISLSWRTRVVSFITLQCESSQNQSHMVITNKQSTLVNFVARDPGYILSVWKGL